MPHPSLAPLGRAGLLAFALLLVAGNLAAQDEAPDEESAEDDVPPADVRPSVPAGPVRQPDGWRVDTLVVDEMSDVVAVRASVAARPGRTLAGVVLGMECVMPRKTLETVLLVPAELEMQANVPLVGEAVATRMRWGEEPAKAQTWGRYKAVTDEGGMPLQLLAFVAPTTRSLLKHRRLRVELPLASKDREVADFDLGADAAQALAAVFAHCRRKMPTP